MALNIKKQAEKLVPLSVEVDGETVNLKYRANLITPAFLAGPESESEFCAAVIAEWDITLDGDAFAPTLANLQSIEAGLSYQLCYAIIADTKAVAAKKLRNVQFG